MHGSSRKPLHTLVAQRLRADLPSFTGCRLPPVKELCRKYSVSDKTMLKAAAILRDKGQLRYSRGKGMLIVGRIDNAARENGTAAAVRRHIEEKILLGRLKAGQRLPKLQHFVAECEASRDVVREALVELEKTNLVHRVIKKWYVGPPRPRSGQSVSVMGLGGAHRPAIIMIIADYFTYGQYVNFHTAQSPFHALQTELDSAGIEIIVASWRPGILSATLPAGRGEIETLIKKLGSGYMGCFIAEFAWNFPNLDEWIRWLRTYNKPVSVFNDDVNDQNGLPGRMPGGSFRVYRSFGKAARMAVDILYRAGHRHIALVVNKEFNKEDWFAQRRAIIHDHRLSCKYSLAIADIVMRQPPGLRPMSEEWHYLHPGESMLQRVRNICTDIGVSDGITAGEHEAIKRQLEEDQPELVSLLSRKSVTAVIAANDTVAFNFLTWMTYTGRSVPQNMSLISFDNLPALSIHRFSSLDFGQAELGYFVAHRFIGDIPVQKDRNGNITVMPRLFDRESIIAPAKMRKRA